MENKSIKELTGLQCEAIAVQSPYGVDKFAVKESIRGRCYVQYFKGIQHRIYLPLGEWTILGRADELKFDTICKVMHPFLAPLYWERYMEANELTNELILTRTP